jgi:16S rRNA (guanine966-N2)-methyltransferase
MSRIRIIAGTAGGLFIQSPPKFTSRPTQERVREALFSSVASFLPDSDFLDLYAGSGAVGIEALSRSAATATFVEIDRRFSRTIQDNLKHCRFQAEILTLDTSQFLTTSPQKTYDIIFADPPYDQKAAVLDDLPFASTLSQHLAPEGIIVWEHDQHSSWQNPPGLCISKVKKIGETRLTYMRHDH